MALARSLVKCALLATLVSLSLATVNVDKTGVAGESVPMICDLPLADPPVIAWKDWVNNMNREAIEVADEAGNINQKHPERDNFQVDIVKHQLTIKSFRKNMTGDYVCESRINETITLKKMFTINYVGKLKCTGRTELKENDDTILTCAVDYMGSLLFVPEWLSPGVTEGLKYNEPDEILLTKRTVEFTAEPDMDGKVFTCQIADDNNDVLQKCDMKVSVKYGVSRLVIEPESPTYYTGQEITCTAHGNPVPQVSWVPAPKEVVTGEGYQKMIVPVPAEGDSKDLTYTCVATNELAGKPMEIEKAISFGIQGTAQSGSSGEATPAPSTGGASVSAIVIGLIVALLILIVIIVAVVCVLRGRSKQPKGSKPVPASDAEYGREMTGKGANSYNVKYEDVEKQPAESPENHLLPNEDPKEKTVDGLEYAELQFDDDLDLSPLPPLSSSIDEITYVKV